MPATIPTRGMIRASAAQAIAFPIVQRAAAVDAVANYLRLLRDWTGTRYAVAGNGASVVAVGTRNSYIYARLGGAAGDLIEAKLINLLEPQDNDALLVRRENPGGAGGWLVLDNLAALQQLRACTFVGGVLWTLRNELIWKIDALVSDEVTDVAPGQDNMCLGAPQDGLLLYSRFGQLTSRVYRSLDGGVNFSQVAETHESSRVFNPEYGNVLDFDRGWRTNGYGVSFLSVYADTELRDPLPAYVDVVRNQWYPPAAGTYPLSIEQTDLDYFFAGMTVYAILSTDGGATWSEIALDNLGELVPSRIGSVGYAVRQTQYEGSGCVLTSSGNPFGIPAVIVADTPPHARLYFAVCAEPYDPDDPESNGLPFVDFPFVVGLLCVAAKQDGTGCYVFVETMHIGPQTDLGEWLSPWSPNHAGVGEWVWTQWLWHVDTVGGVTRRSIALGSEFNAAASFDGTDTGGAVRSLRKAVVNPTNPNQIFSLLQKHIGAPDTGAFYFGVDAIDFGAATLTSTSAPFESDATLDALDIVCTESGAVFVYVVTDDFSQASIWKWDGATWTETDVTTQVDASGFVGGGKFAYSQADMKLYLVLDSQIIGETMDDGATWIFGAVSGDAFALRDVDTY